VIIEKLPAPVRLPQWRLIREIALNRKRVQQAPCHRSEVQTLRAIIASICRRFRSGTMPKRQRSKTRRNHRLRPAEEVPVPARWRPIQRKFNIGSTLFEHRMVMLAEPMSRL
jgi:hypothetical protein